MSSRPDPDRLVDALRRLAAAGEVAVTSSRLAQETDISLASVKRRLDELVKAGMVARTGTARATRYAWRGAPPPAADTPAAADDEAAVIPWSPQAIALRRALAQPLGTRAPVTYQREFVDAYVPNVSSLLPATLAAQLAALGRMPGQQPAGTYARKVLEPLLIDLSWSSSRLEGNRFSLLDTQELFKAGVSSGDPDAVMLLNHRRAIEFLVDAVPQYGLTAAVIRNVHAVLLQDLLPEVDSLGAIRSRIVHISDTTYVPTQVPSLLQEMFTAVVDKARQVHNPAEAAFFLWIQLAYLQPFEDGNKRTSRLAANIPLMLHNCAPLSFLDVSVRDYALAMMGVYERLDTSAAVDLFEWTYRRSVAKYAVVLASMGTADPLRLRLREALNDAIAGVVLQGRTPMQAVAGLSLSDADRAALKRLLDEELDKLDVHNCGRYRLSIAVVERWIAAGRPRHRKG